MVSDGLAVLAGWMAAVVLQIFSSAMPGRSYWRAVFEGRVPIGMLLGIVSGFLIALLLISDRLHLYNPARPISILHEQRLTLQACLTCGLLVSGGLYLLHGFYIPRSTFLITLTLVSVLVCLQRLVERTVRERQLSQGIGARNILIVGTGTEAVAVKNQLESVRRLGYRFKGFVEFPGWDSRCSAAEGKRFRDFTQVFEYAHTEFVDEIFVAAPHEPGVMRDLLEKAQLHGIDLRLVPELHDGLAWGREIEYIGQFPTFPLHCRQIPRAAQAIKRIVDVGIALAGLIIGALPMLLIALLVKLDSRGPALYRANRVGHKGRPFQCTKFRTMVADADLRRAEFLHLNEREGVLFKIADDPRVTRVGRILRKYSIDELPQLFDVLRGDMSIVGPRPPIASEVREYAPSHLRRLGVKPGITGLWQVQARQDPSFDSYISLDLAYIENWSLWLDLKIMVRTLGVVLAGTGS